MIAVMTLAKLATIIFVAALIIVAMRIKGRGGDGTS
jgi:hypothetical protein